MDNSDVGNSVPEASELAAAEEAEVEVQNRLENGGGGEHEGVMQVAVASGGGEHEEVMRVAAASGGGEHEGLMRVAAASGGGEHEGLIQVAATSGGGEHEGVMRVSAASGGGEHEGLMQVAAASGGREHEGLMQVAAENGGGDDGFREKRKRGRPRKQLGEIRQELRLVAEDSGGPQKRGRGRPKGSGKWQTLAASLGLSAGEASGSNFTPYIIEIQAGENIVERIWSFSQMTSDSICILSASGTVSSAEIFLPASRGGVIRYEGHFSIVCLNGSHTYDGKRGGKTCLLSAQLANSDGRFCGGAVASSLIAAGPTQIIVSTFRQSMRVQKSNVRPSIVAAPQPHENGTTAAAPLQAENGTAAAVAEAAAQCAVDDEDGILNVVSQCSSADWTSLQPSNV